MLLRAALLFAVANGIPTAYKHDTAIAHEADMDLESMTPEDIQALVPHDAMLEREKYGGGACVEATLRGQATGCPIALAAGETPALGYCKKYFYVDGDVAKKCRHTDSPACQARGDKKTQSASKKCPSGKALAQWYNGAEAGKAAMQADRARALITLDQLRLAQVRLAQVDPGSRLYPGMSSNAFMQWASALGREPEGDIGIIKRDVCRITPVFFDIVSHDFSPEEKIQLMRNCENGDHSSGDQRRSQVVEKWRSFALELVFVLQGIRPAVPYYQGFIHMAATLVVGMCGDCLPANPHGTPGRKAWRETRVGATYSRLRELVAVHVRSNPLAGWLNEQFGQMVGAIERSKEAGDEAALHAYASLHGSVSLVGKDLTDSAQSCFRLWQIGETLRTKGALRTPGLRGATTVPNGVVTATAAPTPPTDVAAELTFTLALHAARYVHIKKTRGGGEGPQYIAAAMLAEKPSATVLAGSLRQYLRRLKKWLPGVKSADLRL